MKTADFAVLGLAGLAVYFIVRATSSAKPAATGQAAAGSGWVAEIFNGVTSWGNGWRYFDNGTAIDPDGNYYYNGVKVYQAPR